MISISKCFETNPSWFVGSCTYTFSHKHLSGMRSHTSTVLIGTPGCWYQSFRKPFCIRGGYTNPKHHVARRLQPVTPLQTSLLLPKNNSRSIQRSNKKYLSSQPMACTVLLPPTSAAPHYRLPFGSLDEGDRWGEHFNENKVTGWRLRKKKHSKPIAKIKVNQMEAVKTVFYADLCRTCMTL